MEIYLDTCCLQRPLDDRTFPRINIEAEAVLTILGFVEAGIVTLIASEALDYEISRIPDVFKKTRTQALLKLASKKLRVTEKSESVAQTLVSTGIKPMDALHLALAIEGSVDCFCTSDDKLLKKIRNLENLTLKTASPLELIMELTA
jgi:predicted nucleic acid-binding protein